MPRPTQIVETRETSRHLANIAREAARALSFAAAGQEQTARDILSTAIASAREAGAVTTTDVAADLIEAYISACGKVA